MTTIELSDEQATALRAQAAARGLTLEQWLVQLAEAELPAHRYRLEDLIAQCDPDTSMTDEDRAWMNGRPVGREVL